MARTRCPACAAPITVEVKLTVAIGWRDALKLRLAGPKVREQLVDEMLLRLQRSADDALTHPEDRR